MKIALCLVLLCAACDIHEHERREGVAFKSAGRFMVVYHDDANGKWYLQTEDRKQTFELQPSDWKPNK